MKRVDVVVTIATLAAIVVASVALSLFWSRLVPMFEAPDEPTHYDYVLSIARAGHLIRERDALTAYAANADLSAAEAFTSLGDVAFHPGNHEPRGYGDPAFYARLDRAVAAVPLNPEVKRNPWIMTLYPFGYYAVAALWLRVGEIFTSSFSALFFWVRALSSVMLGLTLLMSFAIARRIGLSRGRSLAIVAIIGILPLTSFVSSYIQPDNLAWLLLTAIWLTSLELVASPSLFLFALLGILAGLLLDTKVQFFLAAAVGVVPYVLLNVRLGERRTRLVAGLLAASPVAAFALVQNWVSSDTREHVLRGQHFWANSDAFRAAYAAGAAPLIRYSIDSLRHALVDYFLGGSSTQSFWGVFGWLDTPLTFGSPTLDLFVRFVILTTTVAIIALSVVWIARLTRFALSHVRSGLPAAMRVFYGDPIIPTYGAFIAIMFALYVYLDNSFGAQGRNWLPVILPMLAIATSRVFSGRLARGGSVVVIGLFLTYAVLGCAVAPGVLVSRYYAEAAAVAEPLTTDTFPFPRTETRTLADIAPLAPPGGTSVTVVSRGDRLAVSGWAVDTITTEPPYAVYISIDDQLFVPTVYGGDRPDVALALGNARYRRSGFSGGFDTSFLRSGRHVVFLRVVSSTGRFAYRSSVSKDVIIK